MKLESITPSDSKTKKYKAVFLLDDNKTKTIQFGAKGYKDFTDHKDVDRRYSYLKRHGAREDFNNPLTAGALSRWILWEKPTIRESIAYFKKKFKL